MFVLTWLQTTLGVVSWHNDIPTPSVLASSLRIWALENKLHPATPVLTGEYLAG